MTSFTLPARLWSGARFLLLPAVLTAGLTLAACSEDDPADTTATSTATSTVTASLTGTPSASPTGSPTSTATAEPTGTPGNGEPTVEDAVTALQGYFDAINAEDYETAYATWADGGASSNQSYEEFVAGFAETDSVLAQIGEPGRVDAAAGSRYIEIPVTIVSTNDDGSVERFEGHYVFVRAVVDGATEAQRSWHIYSADVEQVGG